MWPSSSGLPVVYPDGSQVMAAQAAEAAMTMMYARLAGTGQSESAEVQPKKAELPAFDPSLVARLAKQAEELDAREQELQKQQEAMDIKMKEAAERIAAKRIARLQKEA